jgi:hypothetical protein
VKEDQLLLNKIVEIIKRKANKRVIEGRCGKQRMGQTQKGIRYKVTISRIKQIGYIL